MGWMRTLLLGDIGNRLDIADAEREVSRLRSSQQKTVRNLQTRDLEVGKLKDELERQKLATQALTRFLVEKKIIDEEALAKFIEVVDAEDGVIDGKMSIDTHGRRLVFDSKKEVPEGTFKSIKPK